MSADAASSCGCSSGCESSEAGLRFAVQGLDCQNEVRQLKTALGPLVGEESLSFDTKRGELLISPRPSVDVAEISDAIASTGMRPTLLEDGSPVPLRLTFDVKGLDCQNEVRQLKAAVGPLVGGEDRLSFDTKAGTMELMWSPGVSAPEIASAVRATGMVANLRHTPGEGSASPARYRVRGLDCQNEVRQLKAAVGPLAGGEDKLAFDTKAGWMEVTAPVPANDVIRAVAQTGMSAEPWSEAQAAPAEVDACGMGCSASADAALAPPVPVTEPGHVVFRIHGMDCGDEVAALKREVGPLVGGEDRLGFDLLNGRMSVKGEADTVPFDAVAKAVARTGMKAELWQEGETSAAAVDEDRRRRVQSWLTAASGAFTALGFALHAWSAGGVVAAFEAGEHGLGATPGYVVVLYSLAILCAVRYVAPKAWLAARRLRPDMNLLMVVAVAGAIGIGAWFEAATVSFFFALSLALEAWSLGRARRAVAALMELAPPTARVKQADGRETEMPAGDVPVGAHIVIRPGDKIPLDGRVAAGFSEVNQAPITGESMPVEKGEGAEVFAGTINGQGALEVVTTKAARDTTLAQIVRMVGSAQGRRAPSEQWVERFARVYTPAVMALAVAVFLLAPVAFGGDWGVWFYRALILLVIACPCALVISTPVSIVASLAGAAKQGVLVKGGLHLETPARLKAIAMDKTGTLTEGRPRVVEVVPSGERSEVEVLALAAALEARSEHPIARAILQRAEQVGVGFKAADGVQALAGKGVTGQVGGRAAWLGSRRYLEERRVTSAPILRRADEMSGAGRTIVAVGDDQELWGLIAVADSVRPEAKGIVRALRAAGIERVVMLTGDNRATAEAIARETGIDEVRAELLPGDKVAAVEDLVARHGTVAMVGDGVNDAPAMARASLGIAMGAIGSDAAIETADVALMSDDLSKLPWLVRHSRATLAIIRQNVAFSVGVKVLFTVLTVLGFASLWGAIAADVGASLLVVLNGLRLLNRDQASRGRGAAPGAPTVARHTLQPAT